MNIGVDIKAFKNGSTGISRYVRSILDELQQIDSENRYVLMECRPSGYAPVNPKWEKISQNRKMPGTLWLQTVVPGLIRKHGVNIFWAPEQIAPVLRLPRGVRIVTTIHDFTYLRCPETCQMSVRLIQKLLTCLTIKKSAALVPVSEYIKNELAELFPHTITSRKIVRPVYNGVKGWNGADQPAKRENFLFFPGNLEPRKNLSRLIRALEAVNKSGFELDLHLCGPSGWKNSGFHKLVESSPVRERIKHLGYLPDNELRNQYLTCKAVIFPSVYEGFGLPVIEALRLGTPVLTSKGTVMEDVAGGNALYFDPYEENSIAETIINFLEAGGPVIDQTSLDRYTWRRSAEDLLGVFNELGRSGNKT
jgi:glycosyltransferase involved in cell wall biosynthesis